MALDSNENGLELGRVCEAIGECRGLRDRPIDQNGADIKRHLSQANTSDCEGARGMLLADRSFHGCFSVVLSASNSAPLVGAGRRQHQVGAIRCTDEPDES